MSSWSNQVEDEIAQLLKDWLKQQGRTQSDLGRSLQTASSRMPALLEALGKDYHIGGIPKVAARLCSIEDEWSTNLEASLPEGKQSTDPFGQLDLLLQEIRDDCEESENHEDTN